MLWMGCWEYWGYYDYGHDRHHRRRGGGCGGGIQMGFSVGL